MNSDRPKAKAPDLVDVAGFAGELFAALNSSSTAAPPPALSQAEQHGKAAYEDGDHHTVKALAATNPTSHYLRAASYLTSILASEGKPTVATIGREAITAIADHQGESFGEVAKNVALSELGPLAAKYLLH